MTKHRLDALKQLCEDRPPTSESTTERYHQGLVDTLCWIDVLTQRRDLAQRVFEDIGVTLETALEDYFD